MTLFVKNRMVHHSARFTLILLVLAGGSAAQAAAIHKWVDDKGVTHYSDAPPQDTQIPVTRLAVETGISTPKSADGDRSEHYYSIARQWQRMQQESLQRQQRELQRAALKRASQPATRTQEYREDRSTYYVNVYPRRHHRHHRHHQRHRKGHYPSVQHYGVGLPSPGGRVRSGFPKVIN